MSGYSKLYLAMLPGLLARYELSEQEFRYSPHIQKVINCSTHMHHLLLIEFCLQQHREKYKYAVMPLNGEKALHHLAMTKSNLNIIEIRKMNQFDLVFYLLEEFDPEKLNEQDQGYLKTILKDRHPAKIDLTIHTDWQIGSGDQFLNSAQ